MFRFSKIEVVHWDFWERFSLPLDANVITIVGPNGSGKTTLLDALRTLLGIDCSTGRDYKRYVRRNDKSFCWLRAVVENKRQDSGFRPFFPLIADEITLACRIEKKGGDWQRQYLVSDGDVPIETLAEDGKWLGVREYRQYLDRAGLTHAIRHVLALEQGDTDKLCEYNPRQLLELVFSVFGDQEVLDNYQQAKNEQVEIGRELEKLEEELARLGVRLREAEANVNSYREWKSLNNEYQKLCLELLPRAGLADLHEKILIERHPIIRKRSELWRRQDHFKTLEEKIKHFEEAIQQVHANETSAEIAIKVAEQDFTDCRDAASAAERILKEKQRLEELCRQQQTGFDAAALAAEQRHNQGVLAANDHDLIKLREERSQIQSRLVALKSGEKDEPGFVKEFRQRLQNEKIEHQLLSDIVEINRSDWQAALEGVLNTYAHVVLLSNPSDRKRAWELGECMKYRHFVVSERTPMPKPDIGSLLEIVSFNKPPTMWIVDLLNRIQRVETVDEGNRLPLDTAWVTREGYFRERRGGRFVGIGKRDFKFGEAARKNVCDELEEILKNHAKRERALQDESSALSRRISEIHALIEGVDAARQLEALSAECTLAEKRFPELAKQAHEAAVALEESKTIHKQVQGKHVELQIAKAGTSGELKSERESLSREDNEVKGLRRQHADKIFDYRQRRRQMPSEWYSRRAIIELREKYESSDAVKRDISRLKERLEQGTWIVDEQVVAIKEKLQVDHDHLEETIKARRIHHNRHMSATNDARDSYINVLRATVRQYSRNVRKLGELAGIGVEIEPPHLVNDDVALTQAGLNVKFNFDQKGMIGLNDGEASGGQQVMKSLILLIGLLMDENRLGGFVFIDEPFAHLDVFNIDKVGAFLESTQAQYVLTTPNTHNVNVFTTSDLTLVTQKRHHPYKWAQPVAFLRREKGLKDN